MIVYLLELRKRIFYILSFFLLIFCINLYFSNELFKFFLYPLTHTITNHLIATQATAPVFLPLYFAADLALIATMPFAVIQSVRFVLPALYPKEKYIGKIFIATSLILFVLGALFSFYLILPWMFHWFYKTMPLGISWMPEINSIINFMTRMLIIFGVIFQIPLWCFILEYFNFFSLNTLIKARPYVIVGAFIIGMLLTPPDVLSQIIVALPLWFLYEFGIILIKLSRRWF